MLGYRGIPGTVTVESFLIDVYIDPCFSSLPPFKTMPSNRPLGICALCLEEKILCESHIISKFIWKQSGIIGGGKSFPLVSTTHPELNEPHRQDGLKEYLLCENCEKQLHCYETYVARKLFHPTGPHVNRPTGHFVWRGLDYSKLKLFQMSILWRMSVSQHLYFSNVDLGSHQENLRQMIADQDPGEPWQYGCVGTLLNHLDEPLRGIISQPLRSDQGYSYVIAGLYFHQFVLDQPGGNKFLAAMAQRDGTWPLLRGEIMDFGDLRPQVENLRDQITNLAPTEDNSHSPGF